MNFIKKQKKIIRDETVEVRLPVTLWIAERLETLSTSDILSDKNIKDRDDQTIHLESTKKGIFNPMVKNIATLLSLRMESSLPVRLPVTQQLITRRCIMMQARGI